MTAILDISCNDTFPKLKPGEDNMLGIPPVFHIFSACQVLHLPFTCGCPVVIQGPFNPVEFCANIKKYKVAFAFVVPPILVVLTRHPAVDKYDLSGLQYLRCGAAPPAVDLIKQVKARLLATRDLGAYCAITQGYGLTETTTSINTLLFRDADRKISSMRRKDKLWVRGKTVMKGYLNNPSATANTITPDRWFKTGDIAIPDSEGYFYVVDRLKELIKYKGFQGMLPPAELECVLMTHPEIADMAMIGVNSVEQATEPPRAYVVPSRPEKLKALFERGIARWIETQVAQHKYLGGGVAVIDVVPRSAAGKILRRKLRELAAQEAARGEINTTFSPRL
ncbi:hypothetical protein B0H10DRAFT_2226270 [Mycena sp. CBHHK59/15]|nr:hypothetical protein B0H10DRAFT_2226270 [Mycena sp. CBHHK59/15]